MSINPCLPTGADRYLCAQGAANRREAAYETRALPGHVQGAIINSPWQKKSDGPRVAPEADAVKSDDHQATEKEAEENSSKTPNTASDQTGLW